MKRRITYRVIMLILLIAPLFFMPLNLTYSFKQVNRKISYDAAELMLSPLPSEELGQVYEGPDPDAIYLRLQAGEFEIAEPSAEYIYTENESVIIQMEGFLRDDSPGNPALPYQTYPLALPPDAIVTSLEIEIIHLHERAIAGNYKIAPAPPYLLDQEPTEDEFQWDATRWGMGKDIVDGYNILIYDEDAFYPANYTSAVSGNQLRKWKVATIEFYPIRYNPVQSNLIIAEEIIFKLKYERDSSHISRTENKKLLKDFVFDERAKDIFLNYDQAKDWYLEPLYDGSLGDMSNILEDPSYTIITTDEIYTNSLALDDFCFHKQDLGFTVMVVTEHETHTVDGTSGSYSFVDAAGGFEDVVGEPPNERAEKIRQWLKENYLTLGIEYVLLIGNPDPDNVEPADLVGDIPMQICWTSLTGECPTDQYYADLTGDWNLDDDDYIGEWYDVKDPALGYSYSNLPTGVTGDQFCVRWDGVVEVSGATGTPNVYIEYTVEGQTQIWLDEDGDGIDENLMDDVILTYEADEHHPEYSYHQANLADGTYQIIITYTQSTSDAYTNVKVTTYSSTVTASFKHDDGTGNFEDGLEAKYYNDNDFSSPPEVEEIDTRPNLMYIEDGDRGSNGVDFFPEVIVGRIPFYSEDENTDGIPDYEILDAILTKTINYENADIHEETWRRRVLISTPYMYDWDATPGDETADYQVGEYLMDNTAPPPLWEWYRIHEEDYPDVTPDADINTGCTVNAMVDAWNDPLDPDDGRGVVMWRTHGSQTGAGHVFDESRIGDLDNSKPSIVIQTTCQNGHPEVEEYYGTLYYPLAYSLLKHGAIATFASTRNSAGGTFNPDNIDIAYKNNPYMCHFLAKGVFYNSRVGDVLSHMRTSDANLGSYWGQIFKYNLYGDPSLSLFGPSPKSNNDIVFLLDGSGSMLSEGKWDAAVDATVLYYELMQELRHPAFHDRYGTAVFRWDNQASSDISTDVPPGSGLQEISVPLTASILNAETPESYYFTPIGEGLSLAVDLFDLDSEDSFYSNKVILLLSDGQQNRGIDPLLVEIPEEIVVHSVGLGEDYINPVTISDIAIEYGGEYRISPNPRDMEDFFIQIFCDTSWKLQDLTVTGTTVPIDEDIAVFIVVWDDPETTVSFNLDPPGADPDITPTSSNTEYLPMEVTFHAPAPGTTHAFYVCKNIPGTLFGDWQFTDLSLPLTDVLLKVVEDPPTIVDFDIESVDAYTGQPIILTATVTEDGYPKTGLIEVYTELLRSPGQSVGSLMAMNSPSSTYPTYPSNTSDRTLRSHYLLGVMENLGLDSLDAQGGPRIYLRDDGLGCDSRANDGIYTGYYSDTGYEGSYSFKFRARGDNTDDVTFDRTETLSKYIKFGTSPSETSVEFISTVPGQQENVAITTIRVAPRNTNGSYLGPFLGDTIQFWTTEGTVGTDFNDNLDGSYTFTLTHPSDVTPRVTISVNNFVVAELVSATVPSDNIWVLLILIISVVAVVVVVVIVRIRPVKIRRIPR
ncbi:MAG: C25 family cysteine peptidase [Candidatus Thorarchaeota archaeon]